MCTAIAWQKDSFLFGRNLDLEYRYQESVTMTPRHYPFKFHNDSILHSHYAMIGTAYVKNKYPLYYDGFNEHGLCIAGLYFPEYAHYFSEKQKENGITPFELIPLLLSTCKSAGEAIQKLKEKPIVDISFSKELPNTPLHWLIADSQKSFVVEPTFEGTRIYENPIGILTNSPPFPFHLCNLRQFMHLSRKQPTCDYLDSVQPFSNGFGAIGMPGDLSSSSRFIRAAFTKLNSAGSHTGTNMVSQFFHILESVSQQEGSVLVNGKFEKTLYSNCFDPKQGIYYYTTYENRRITAIDLFAENLDTTELISYPMENKESILWANKKPDRR